MSLQYNRALDGLRGVAILLVIGLHYANLPNCGWVGVQLFFVLSGFLITQILRNERHAALGTYLKRFYVRRALRIFPLYFGYLLVLGAVWALTGKPGAFGPSAVPLFTYTYNLFRAAPGWQQELSPFFTHFWSLCVEEQFYLVWPLVVFFAGPRALRWTLGVMLVAAPVCRLLLAAWLRPHMANSTDIAEAVYWSPFSHMDAFAFGAGVAVFQLTERVSKGFQALCLTGAVTLSLGLVNLGLLVRAGSHISLTSLGYPLPLFAHGQYVWGYTLLNLTFALLVLCVLQGERRLQFLENRALVEVGKVSYGVYILHWPAWAIFEECTRWLGAQLVAAGLPVLTGLPKKAGTGVLLLVYVVLVYGLARLSYRKFESPFIAMKDRFAPPLARQASPPPVPEASVPAPSSQFPV